MANRRDVKETLTGAVAGTALADVPGGLRRDGRQAVQETLSYEQYLLELTKRECQRAAASGCERLLRDSRLPLEKIAAERST